MTNSERLKGTVNSQYKGYKNLEYKNLDNTATTLTSSTSWSSVCSTGEFGGWDLRVRLGTQQPRWGDIVRFNAPLTLCAVR